MSDLSWVADKATGILIPSGYKAGKLYGIVPQWAQDAGTPATGFDFTFTRNSLGTRTNPAGLIETMANDVGRLQYPSCPSVLLEPSRTNLAIWSEDFENWSDYTSGTGLTPVVTPNVVISPDGTQNADNIYLDLGGSHTTTDRSMIRLSNITWTVESYYQSFWMKAGSPTDVGKVIRTTVFGTTESAIDITLTSDWTYYKLQKTTTSTSGNIEFELRGQATASTINVNIWGSQFELGPYPTSYIKTEAAAANRAVDDMSLSGLQTNGILGATEGTWYVQFDRYDGASSSSAMRFGLRGTTDLGFGLSGSNINIRCNTKNDNLNISMSNTKICLRYTPTGLTMYLNGSAQALPNCGSEVYTSPTNFITLVTPTLYEVKEMAMFPNTLTDAQMIELTT